jgi:redox-sensitive bicupin YhaK (pirin superfamily)
MLNFRDRGARGAAKMGWLDSKHSFSFGSYHDPKQMGFRSLRVINEDRVVPGAGFPRHAMPTWRSSPTCWKARSNIRTASAPVR